MDAAATPGLVAAPIKARNIFDALWGSTRDNGLQPLPRGFDVLGSEGVAGGDGVEFHVGPARAEEVCESRRIPWRNERIGRAVAEQDVPAGQRGGSAERAHWCCRSSASAATSAPAVV